MNGGTMATVVTYPPKVTLAGVWSTGNLRGYHVQYSVDGGSVQTLGTFDLRLGWNMFTFTVGRSRRSLFVLGL
jgi:hypothetical protein